MSDIKKLLEIIELQEKTNSRLYKDCQKYLTLLFNIKCQAVEYGYAKYTNDQDIKLIKPIKTSEVNGG